MVLGAHRGQGLFLKGVLEGSASGTSEVPYARVGETAIGGMLVVQGHIGRLR